MSSVTRTTIMDLIGTIVARKRGVKVEMNEATTLAELDFRSLDISELAIRTEMVAGNTLNFAAAPIRQMMTVKDVIDFLLEVCNASATAN